MANSAIEVINKALVLLGANTITSLSEGSVESTYVGVVFDGVRQSCLRLHPWNFAIKDIELSAILNGSDFQRAYQYMLPANSLRLLTVYDDGAYKLKGKSIYTNKDTCKIRYVYDNIDYASWAAGFTDVVAYKLAAELAYTLTKSTTLMGAMTELFGKHLIEAKAIDGSEDIEDVIAPYDNVFINVRF